MKRIKSFVFIICVLISSGKSYGMLQDDCKKLPSKEDLEKELHNKVKNGDLEEVKKIVNTIFVEYIDNTIDFTPHSPNGSDLFGLNDELFLFNSFKTALFLPDNKKKIALYFLENIKLSSLVSKYVLFGTFKACEKEKKIVEKEWLLEQTQCDKKQWFEDISKQYKNMMEK